MGQHHRAQRGGDQQRRGDLEGEHVAREDQLGQRRHVARRVHRAEAGGRGEHHVADAQRHQGGEGEPDDDRPEALAPDRLDERVGRVDADQHQHEQEQHHHGAGVDDDLHGGEERRVLDGVEDRQREHDHAEHQGAVDGSAAEDEPECRADRDDGEHPERDGLTHCRVPVGSSPLRSPRGASGGAAAPSRR